ncbi:hypothetical protein D3C75_793070 [compost metagenome]
MDNEILFDDQAGQPVALAFNCRRQSARAGTDDDDIFHKTLNLPENKLRFL